MALVRDHALVLVLQIILVILYGVFTTTRQLAPASNVADQQSNEDIGRLYAMFQDVHVMIYIGFGYLMCFLRRYGFSSLGFTFFVGAILCQWAILCRGFFQPKDPLSGRIPISLDSLVTADIGVAAVLISVGALIGKASPLQLIIMGFIELIICAANEHLGVAVFKAVDAGESMFIHVFGAYFGLAVSRTLHMEAPINHPLEGSSYTSDLFAMVGTVFLWLFWPSFNAAGLDGAQRERALINTYISLAVCTAVTFAVSGLVSSERKFDMVHIQNATLAGGVAIGTGCNLVRDPYAVGIIGAIAGILSTLGYRYIQPHLLSNVNLHDTCGVHNLHGIPGLLAGLVGVFAAFWPATVASGVASVAEQALLFPARAPPYNSTELTQLREIVPSLEPGDARTAGEQAAFQLAALASTWIIAVTAGALTGFTIKMLDPKKSEKSFFSDEENWEVPPSEIMKKTSISEPVTGLDQSKDSDLINAACYDNPMQVIDTSSEVGGKDGV